ncbi:MAG: thiamine biosynthesis protein ThiJ [Rhodospirillales bacterium CG15_BIG_FIL_POST_REV_8_21_14_020_66_15]|nr:MAG: thiamine biosynthesis protein ThiJ [Rhodospirillales bacterium CG15_BIG_FIL_POST_REV_8_21_14_020_66_15]
MAFHVGLLIFPDIMQLDMTGPHEVFTKLPDTKVYLIWKTLEPVTAAGGMRILPDVTFETCPELDLICVPGGGGMNALLNDADTLDFLRKKAKEVRYVTSVCTGSLVLGAAGLLKGKRSACHWMSRDMLKAFGAIPDPTRVVIDGNHISGGGVTAGIDFALTVAAKEFGEDVAKAVQLGIEYNPHPPFNAGSPEAAGPAAEKAARDAAAGRQKDRQAAVDKATRALNA